MCRRDTAVFIPVHFISSILCFYFLRCCAFAGEKTPKTKHGKHGDGVQQGELKENTKEEEKSAD